MVDSFVSLLQFDTNMEKSSSNMFLLLDMFLYVHASLDL